MKNLKISSKIMLGFGIVISCMVIFVVFVLFSLNNTVANVHRMQANSQLQTITKDLLSRFYEARLNAAVIYIKNDDAAYARLTSNLNDVHNDAQSVSAMISANEDMELFKEDMANVIRIIEEWQKQVSAVQAANKNVDNFVASVDATKEYLNSASRDLYEYQMGLARDEATQDVTADYRLRRVDRLEFCERLVRNVEYIGSSFETALKSYDPTGLIENQQVLDSTMADLSGFVADSSIPFNIERGGELLGFLADVDEDIHEFLDTCTERGVLAQDTEATGQQALVAINKLLEDIDIATEDLVSATSRATTTYRVVVVAIALAALLFAVLFSLRLAKSISKPVVRMNSVLSQVGTSGNLAFPEKTMKSLRTAAKFNDEIGQSMGSFVALLDNLTLTGDLLSRVAKGDLSVDVRQLSADDTIGVAVSHMIENLNQMFGDINACTEQVSIGSKQISQGAQSLSMGSAQQADAVQQLSASIAQIAQQTQENARMANSAATLADTIKQNAEVGNRQMAQMTIAVEEINQASQSISKVIKVIDDIAFQTNILALNAAVEAARAGQHGKGFAVVAEEVRNLAAKSAEAAKDTGALIANSMEKAALGAQIAGQTAASLTEIVSGINQSTVLVNDIARSSEEQSSGIAQVNTGINQIAQVVQQNNSTAEQSAAAAQQLSGQSAMLEEMLQQFKLKDQGQLGAGRTQYLSLDASDEGKY